MRPLPRRSFALFASTAAAAAVGAARPVPAAGSLFFFFDPQTARPGDTVSIRTAGTPFRPAAGGTSRVRVYLVENRVAAAVDSRHDRRLHPIGTLVVNRFGRGRLVFEIPKIDSGVYAAAAWCPPCAHYSFGRKFFTIPVGRDVRPRYRDRMLLRVEPDSSAALGPRILLAAVCIAALVLLLRWWRGALPGGRQVKAPAARRAGTRTGSGTP